MKRTSMISSVLLGALVLLASDASADRVVRIGVYCVSAETYQTSVKSLRAGERQPQLSIIVSNRSEIEDEHRIYSVVPLNDEVFRELIALEKDARVCLMAGRMSSRHGRDILFTWNVEACVDFECTNVPRYEAYVQGEPLRRAPETPETPATSPDPETSDPEP